MHPSHVPIDAGMLRTLYVEQELTTLEIAAQLGCGATTISRFLGWIQETIHRLLGVGGSINEHRRPSRRPTYALRYAKGESIRLLTWMYRASHAPCLVRKRNKAVPFLPATTISPKSQ